MTGNLVLVYIDYPWHRTGAVAGQTCKWIYAWRILHQCQTRRADCPDMLQNSAKILYRLAMTGRQCNSQLLQCVLCYTVYYGILCCTCVKQLLCAFEFQRCVCCEHIVAYLFTRTGNTV